MHDKNYELAVIQVPPATYVERLNARDLVKIYSINDELAVTKDEDSVHSLMDEQATLAEHIRERQAEPRKSLIARAGKVVVNAFRHAPDKQLQP